MQPFDISPEQKHRLARKIEYTYCNYLRAVQRYKDSQQSRKRKKSTEQRSHPDWRETTNHMASESNHGLWRQKGLMYRAANGINEELKLIVQRYQNLLRAFPA